MKLAYIVTEFPKITETFILREILEFERHGHEVRIYYLTRYRRNEVVHHFAQPLLKKARGAGYLFDRAVVRSMCDLLAREPSRILRILTDLIRGFVREPILLAKSLFIVPKSLAFAREMEEWGAEHIHAGFAGHPATCAWIVNGMTGIPYSVSCHAHDIFRSQAMLDRKFAAAAFVRSISEFNKRFILDRVAGIEERKIMVVHCGVDTGEILPDPISETEVFRLLYVGALQKRKGVDVLLRALAERPLAEPWHCEIVGNGPVRRELEALARKLGLLDHVTFQGALPFQEVREAFRNAQVVIVPSIVGPGGRTEGIPTVIMESLAHLRPVIASRVTGIPELVRHGESGYLVDPGEFDWSCRRDRKSQVKSASRGRNGSARP